MRKVLSLILCITLFSLCLDGFAEETVSQPEPNWDQEVHFTGMDDENFLPYMEDTIYSELVKDLNSDEYFVESVDAIYVSKEYLSELAYNSQKNIFYGYSLSDLDQYFEGTRYVFTVGEDGQTTVVPMRVIEDKTFEQILTNVAIGTGIILVCVVVSVCTSGAGAPAAVHMIFAVGAKTAATCALSGTVISGVTSAAVKYYETGDMREALKAAAVGGSEGFKWGAASGAVSGMAAETWGLYKATRLGKEIKDGLTMNQAALIQKESGYPLDVIKQFHSFKEYEVFKNAGLTPRMVNGRLALARTDINLFQVDPVSGKTNLELMRLGRAPLDATGKAFELHHIGQNAKGTLAILTSSEHDAAALHGYKMASEIDRQAFDKIRKAFWKSMANILGGT